MSLKFCIIIESNSQKTFFTIVLYSNKAAVTSGETLTGNKERQKRTIENWEWLIYNKIRNHEKQGNNRD